MTHMTHRAFNLYAIFLISLAIGIWAAPFGAARSFVGAFAPDMPDPSERATGIAPDQRPQTAQRVRAPEAGAVPEPATFRDVQGRGLLVRVWVNSAGPFNFAVDTGSGAILLSRRVSDEAGVGARRGRTTSITGLSGIAAAAQEATLRTLAIGDRENYLPAKGLALIIDGLPGDVDGVLDPTEAFAPLGYVIDIPNRELVAFDPQAAPVRASSPPPGGAVVRWLHEPSSRRPFVLLDNGQRALLDTGSRLGLAISDHRGRTANSDDGYYSVRDVGGGSVSARALAPTTVAIGALTLRNIPTDLISGKEAGAPVLIGLRALRPFRLKFDPAHRLIEIAPPAKESSR
jgi:predicted aspartyl protease